MLLDDMNVDDLSIQAFEQEVDAALPPHEATSEYPEDIWKLIHSDIDIRPTLTPASDVSYSSDSYPTW